MITLLLIVLTLVAVFVIVKLIDKYVPQSKKWIFTILFWVLAIVIGKALYDSIMEPIEFKKTKEVRYAKVIENLRDIRDAEVAHKTVTGKYSGDWAALVKFIDTAKYTLTQRRDSTIVDVELTKQFGGVEMTKDIVIIDTIGTASVKDSIFKNSTRYKTMMNVPDTDAKFDLKAGIIEKGSSKLPVFEAKVAKKIILAGEPAYLIAEEEETVAVDGVNGTDLSVGSMTEISTNGNWPRKYDEN
ncbi:MAG: hypothetical protein ACPG45_07880 [Flavobacteriaceae bacterium]